MHEFQTSAKHCTKMLTVFVILSVFAKCVQTHFFGGGGFGGRHYPGNYWPYWGRYYRDADMDDSCVTDQNEEGKCVHIHQCPAAETYWKNNVRPTPCYNFGRPIICCPEDNSETEEINLAKRSGGAGSISRERCFKYSRIKFAARSESVTEYGAIRAMPKEFPHMAAIGFGNENSTQWICGGSLISENFVMTAAHCTSSKEYGNAKWVRLGDLNLKSKEDDATAVTYVVKKGTRHPDYKSPSQYNDIGLLELERPVTMTRFIKPACLQTDFKILEGSVPVATGWGQLQYAGAPSDQLMKIELKFYGAEQCRKAYASVAQRRLANGIRNEVQICAGGEETGPGKDTCPGDSGGPLQIRHKKFPNMQIIVGITSFGKGCAVGNSPGVYTRVSNYISWIEEIVWPK